MPSSRIIALRSTSFSVSGSCTRRMVARIEEKDRSESSRPGLAPFPLGKDVPTGAKGLSSTGSPPNTTPAPELWPALSSSPASAPRISLSASIETSTRSGCMWWKRAARFSSSGICVTPGRTEPPRDDDDDDEAAASRFSTEFRRMATGLGFWFMTWMRFLPKASRKSGIVGSGEGTPRPSSATGKVTGAE